MASTKELRRKKSMDADTDVLDVIIVGAGISGIDAAYRLHDDNPALRYVVLERRAQIGGTWDLFRYPGIRSDSDIFTLSLPFEPWHRPEALAQGPDIRNYLVNAARRHHIDEHIRFSTQITDAAWDSCTDTWTVATNAGDRIVGRFLYLATGYYNYDEPYAPTFPGATDFTGPVIHPQQWPDDLDVAGKRIVVIGSGATAVSLVPALARTARHVTMLQRSPSYIVSMPQRQIINPALRKALPAKTAHHIIRARFAAQTAALVHAVHRFPRLGRKVLTAGVRRQLPDSYAIDPHFTPSYNPWDQRLCMVPDGDLFAAITSGTVDMVTDQIERFDASGIELKSGHHLDADIIVTATGLQLLAFGGITLSVDGKTIEPHERFLFKSHLLQGVPNFAWSVGYTNASWTLRADMTARAVAKLLRHMRLQGHTHAYPWLDDPSMPTRPLWDLKAGYVTRAPDALPKAGTRGKWRVRHNYYRDAIDNRFDDVTESMVFGRV